MRFIRYKMEQNGKLLDVAIGYNETNLGIAKAEAYNGQYIIEEDDEAKGVNG